MRSVNASVNNRNVVNAPFRYFRDLFEVEPLPAVGGGGVFGIGKD